MSTANGAGGGPPPGRPKPPLPLVVSIALGALAFVLLVAGVVTGGTGLAVAGFVAGSLSLGAALYWRSLLVTAWAAQKEARRRD